MLNKIKSKTRKSAKAKQSVPSKNDGVKSLLSDEDKYYPSKRLMVCRVCNDNKVSDQTEKLVWDKEQGVMVPDAPRCPVCFSRSMDWPAEEDGTRHDAIAEDRLISKMKSYLIKNSEDYEESDYPTMDIEAPMDTGDSMTLDPSEGFDSSGIIEREMFHKGNIHTTAYAHLVNAGNAPHMQRKLPIDDLVNIRKSQSKALGNLWEEKTYGSASLNRDMKNKMGFRIECDNPTGRRRLSDQDAFRALNNIFFGKEWLKKNVPTEKGYIPFSLRKQIEDKEYEVERNIAVLKTGIKNIGIKAPEYNTRDNLYDTVDLTKLALETDVPWADEKVLDLYKIYKKVLPSVKPKRKNAKKCIYWNTNKYIPDTKKKFKGDQELVV